MSVLTIYLLSINALAFLLMLIDKQKARRHRWRIPEAVLLGAAALGGSVGALFGMWLFHHKTRKAKFFITIPLLLAAQCALLYWIYVH